MSSWPESLSSPLFDRLEAAKAQVSTALVGLLGALLALGCDTTDNLENTLIYVLPFTAGGFLNIALVSLVPDLMQEKQPLAALYQLLCVIAGILAMSLLTFME